MPVWHEDTRAEDRRTRGTGRKTKQELALLTTARVASDAGAERPIGSWTKIMGVWVAASGPEGGITPRGWGQFHTLTWSNVYARTERKPRPRSRAAA